MVVSLETVRSPRWPETTTNMPVGEENWNNIKLTHLYMPLLCLLVCMCVCVWLYVYRCR